MKDNQDFGRKGEDVAVAYLERNGYQVLERNWRSGHKEIDIICRKNGLLVFVEVKSRKTGVDSPSDVVSYGKQKLLLAAANDYIANYEEEGDCRFDLLVVTGTDFQVQHIEDAMQG